MQLTSADYQHMKVPGALRVLLCVHDASSLVKIDWLWADKISSGL